MVHLHDSLGGLSAGVDGRHGEAEVISGPNCTDDVDPTGSGLDSELPDAVVGDRQQPELDPFVRVVVGGAQLEGGGEKLKL